MRTRIFTDLRAAYLFYMEHGATMTTIVPCEKWEVAYHEEGPDFNIEENLHADMIAERYDSAQDNS